MSNQSKYLSKLANARILIIGGSSGIGYALTEALLEHSATVTISSSNPDRLSSATKALQTAYPLNATHIHSVQADLSNGATLESTLQNLLEAAVASMGGKLDHVIYTAGDALATIPLQEMNMANIVQAGVVRFFAPLLLAKFLPAYVTQTHQSSYTITTGSISERPMPNWSVIGAYAGGHHSMVRNLALDLKPVRVNGVSPGVVDTGLWRVEGEEREVLMRDMAARTATGRVGRPEDVVESFLAVVKDWNSTGSVVRSDGGALLL